MAAASPRMTPPRASVHSPLRVMIVDDSIVARTMLARMLGERDGFEIAATAGTAMAAMDMLATMRVDIVLLDLQMPGQSGLSALPALIERGAGAHILVVSSSAGDGAAASLAALRLGAADTLLKPRAGDLAGRFADELADRMRRIARRKDSGVGAVAVPTCPPAAIVVPPARAIACIGIGASTGGVHALAALFAALPAADRPPILVTQHLPVQFMPYFAAQLADISGCRARLAVDGMPLAAGELIVAPGDAHLAIHRTRAVVHVRLDRRPSPSGCRPSVDPMLASIAGVFGAGGVGIILSGMGRDGAIGAAALAEAGGAVLAQDAASSVVWGMPGAVAAAGIARATMPPADLGRCLGEWIAAGAGRWR